MEMSSGKARSALKLMRPRQWVKNGFVLAPLFFGAELGNFSVYPRVFAATISFCLVASAIYIINDICDVQADRNHEKKRLRPIASGAISPLSGASLCLVLFFLSVVPPICVALPIAFYWYIVVYIFINISYSLGLKHVAVLELFLISSGFVIRLLVG